MGWASWNQFGAKIDESIIKGQADAMVSTGLSAAGYKYLNIDDGFFNGRNTDGSLKIDSIKFPKGMKSLVDYIHSKGLKAGFYSEAGEINNRFEIVYTPESTLGVGNVSKNKETVIYKNAELITVENKTNKITSVQIFDATGKLVTSAKPNSNQFSIESSKFQKGLVLFKITTNNKTETKKFFVQ